MLYNPKSLNESLIQHFEYKLEHLLHWEDLNSMHFSIESRVPFLDYRLVEATLAAPPVKKIYRGQTKKILRDAVKGIVPDPIIYRKDKRGFSNPGDKWMRSDQFREYIKDLINSKSFKERGYFNSEMANRQYEKHLQSSSDHSREIWKWINLELWFQKFIDQ
jgi:asparagine synthase (glutamine-hydrolysing)